MKRIGYGLAILLVLAAATEGRGSIVAFTAQRTFSEDPQTLVFFGATRLPLFDSGAFGGQTLVDVQISYMITSSTRIDLHNLVVNPQTVSATFSETYSLSAILGTEFDARRGPIGDSPIVSGNSGGQQTYQLGPFERGPMDHGDVVSGTLHLGSDIRFLGTGDIVLVGRGLSNVPVLTPSSNLVASSQTDFITRFDVTLTYFVATPEPSTFASAGIAGLMGLGFVLRRRKR